MDSLSPHQPTEVGFPRLRLERTLRHRVDGAGRPALCSQHLASWGTGQPQWRARARAVRPAGMQGRERSRWLKGFPLVETSRPDPAPSGRAPWGIWLLPPRPAPARDSPSFGALRSAELPQRRQKGPGPVPSEQSAQAASAPARGAAWPQSLAWPCLAVTPPATPCPSGQPGI